MVDEPEDGPDPELHPELVPIDHEHLPGSSVREHISHLYQSACKARRKVIEGSENPRDHSAVSAFMYEALQYTHKALLVRVLMPPYFKDQEEIEQDFFVVCLQLLGREKPLEPLPTCCVGTQIYNHLIWGVHNLARQKHCPDPGCHDGSDTLEQLERKLPHPQAGRDFTRRIHERQVCQQIAEKYGHNALMWMRGRFHGNSCAEMKRLMELDDIAADRFESLMLRIAEHNKHTKR